MLSISLCEVILDPINFKSEKMKYISISSRRSLRFSIIFFSISLQLISGLAGEASNAGDAKKVVNQGSSGSSIWLKVFIICLGLVAVVAFSVYLFKVWQKKKREEQHSRFLHLFEDDDELEVELGIRD